MHRDPHLGGQHIEEPAGLDHLQALVQHGGRVDGDSPAHHPGGVLERLFGSDGGELRQRQLAEGPAGGRQPDGLHLGVRADAQALMDGVVLAVDGQDGHVARAGRRSEDFAGGDHALLVGQADGLAGQDRGVRGFQACDADDGRDDKVRLRQRGAGDSPLSSVDGLDATDAGRFEPGGEFGSQLFVSQRDQLRPPVNGLREGLVYVAPRGQRGHRVALGKLLDDGEGALADGAGGTENGEFFQGACLFPRVLIITRRIPAGVAGLSTSGPY